MTNSKPTAKTKTNKTTRLEPRSRTFTGCGTCRSRHLKCDEARPTCSCCRRLNLPCQGYTPQLIWITAPPSSSGADSEDTGDKKWEGNPCRYPLFTERHRISMSKSMVRSLGDQSAYDVLLDLDSESVLSGHLHAVGPFSVFRAVQDPPVQKSATSPPSQDSGEEDAVEFILDLAQDRCLPAFSTNTFSDSFQDQDLSLFTADPARSDDWMTVNMNVGLPWHDVSQNFHPDGFDTNLLEPPLSSPQDTLLECIQTIDTLPEVIQRTDTLPEVFQRTDTLPEVFQRTDPLQSPSRKLELGILRPDQRSRPINSNDYYSPSSALARTISSSNSSFLAGRMSVIPAHAAVLLQYLKSEVLEATTSTSSRDLSPWKLLLLPCALETIAEISLWNTTSFTRRSILSTLLAKSAFHLSKATLHGESAASFWLKIGKDHQHAAQELLKSALRAEVEGELKYIEMLMAILSVGVVSAYYDGTAAVRKLLLDAESLIRSRGIPATKTFQHRILHHMYTHLRVILESTNVSARLIRDDNCEETSPGAGVLPVEAPRNFSIDTQNLGDLDLTRQKPENIGYNDIHLDVSGKWHATLYPEMFGVPESLMTLLSQTISLANEKPRLEAKGMLDPAVSAALSEHIGTLEQQIWSWSLQGSSIACGPRPPLSLLNEDSAAHDRPGMESMILAMHQAIIIYFYRRVCNTSAMVVQAQVRKSLELIQPCLDMARFDSDFSVSIAWSTFIAVCEAATPDLKELGLKCLEAVDDHGMFVKCGKPSMMAKAVWEQRARTNNFTFGWPDLMAGAIPCAS